MVQLVLLRHGESIWNQENRFTGWVDVDLSEKGINEAHLAGQLLKQEGFFFDIAFTSVLKRAIRTLWIVLDEMGMMWLPISNSWRLNERHYGALQGLNKSETAQKHGEKEVQIWRGSFDIRPPALTSDELDSLASDYRYCTISEGNYPSCESLEDTINRFMPYWHKTIAPEICRGKKVLIAAHGNSLRALVMHLDSISKEAITNLNIPTGIPLVYELNSDCKPIRHYYLGDPEVIAQATKEVANQGKSH